MIFGRDAHIIESMHQVNQLLMPSFRFSTCQASRTTPQTCRSLGCIASCAKSIVIAWALVRCADGALRGHILVMDLWRSLIFLGAGDPDS